MAATKKMRLVVLLEPETFSAVKAMSEVSGASMSGFVSSIIEEARPQILQIAQAFEVAKRDQLEGLDAMAGVLTGMLHEGTATALELHQDRQKLKREARKPPRKPAGKRKRV